MRQRIAVLVYVILCSALIGSLLFATDTDHPPLAAAGHGGCIRTAGKPK